MFPSLWERAVAKKAIANGVLLFIKATKKIFSAFLNVNSNSRRTVRFLVIFRLRRRDIIRFARSDIAPLRSAMMRCLPSNVAKPHIIKRSRHHLAKPTSFAVGKHHSKKAHICLVDKCVLFSALNEVKGV